MAEITIYPDEKKIRLSEGESILAASLREGIPHVHACGGEGRCTTCRILVLEGEEKCTPRSEAEKTISSKLNFLSNIRLACQTKISGSVKCRRLILDDEDAAIVRQLKELREPVSSGEEKTLAILFADLTGFTTFAENHLSYDVIHILNRYFMEMGKVIEQFGGEINNYMGDGLLALFGGKNNSSAAINSVQAALKMQEELKQFNQYLKENFQTELKARIGIHYGPVILGSLGTSAKARSTVIGDAVNLASRIEAMNKEMNTQILISQCVYEQVKNKVITGKSCRGKIRGKSGDYQLFEIWGMKE